MNIGEFKGKVVSISANLSEERPAIITRIALTPEANKPQEFMNHIIRLNNPDSQRIGFDELRNAFPTQLGAMDDEQLLVCVLSKTAMFTSQNVDVGIEPQVKNGIPQKDSNGRPYYNVRLRSAVRNLDTASAQSLAKRLLSMVTRAKQTDAAFDEAMQGAHA